MILLRGTYRPFDGFGPAKVVSPCIWWMGFVYWRNENLLMEELAMRLYRGFGCYLQSRVVNRFVS